jgi:hypothetical protein
VEQVFSIERIPALFQLSREAEERLHDARRWHVRMA